MQINTSRQSPNHSSRLGHPIRVVILHASVGGLKSSLNWLCNPLARVSSHYVIAQTGTIYQLVAETAAAWHAGDASWQGETAVNEMSIGVELENRTGMDGFVGQDPYPDVQVQRAVELSHNIISRYPGIGFARHLDVALPKGRKTDPKGFDWLAFRARLGAPLPAPAAPSPDLISPQSQLIWESRATQAQCVAYWAAHRPGSEYTRDDVESIVHSYYANATGLDPLLAWAQCLHETAFLSSHWAARPRRNPAGIGVTGEPGKGLSFASWDMASRAHIGRLLAYALSESGGTPAQQSLIKTALALRPLPIAYRGSAPHLQGLDGRWAVPGVGYAQRLADIANAIRGV